MAVATGAKMDRRVYCNYMDYREGNRKRVESVSTQDLPPSQDEKEVKNTHYDPEQEVPKHRMIFVEHSMQESKHET